MRVELTLTLPSPVGHVHYWPLATNDCHLWWRNLSTYILPLSVKKSNYEIYAGQTSSSLVKFIVNLVLTFLSLNKLIIKVYSITNLMVFVLYHGECQYFFI
jgi:hypothetical protein